MPKIRQQLSIGVSRLNAVAFKISFPLLFLLHALPYHSSPRISSTGEGPLYYGGKGIQLRFR